MPNAESIKQSFGIILVAVSNISSYFENAFWEGHIILRIDFALSNRSFPIPNQLYLPSIIKTGLPSQIFFSCPTT